jgi:hypothetical protein
MLGGGGGGGGSGVLESAEWSNGTVLPFSNFRSLPILTAPY